MNAWRRLTIAAKLPLGIGTLLLLVLGGMTGIVYVDVRRAMAQLASERLERVAYQLTEMLGQSADERRSELRALARGPAVRRFLETPSEGNRAALAALLAERMDRGQVEALEVWDSAGRRVVGTGRPLAAGGERRIAALVAGLGENGVGIGPLIETPDGLEYGIAARVSGDDRRLGHIVERRRVASSPQTVQRLTELIGQDAGLLVGNTSDGLWTDLNARVAAPPIDVLGAPAMLTYTREGAGPVFARAQEIPGTPWILVAEFPRAPILAPAHGFLIRAALLSLLLACGGAGVGWMMSRRISGPLRRVTEAAERLARREPVEPVRVARHDEVGRLAASFNTMADQVVENQQELERHVFERTAALQAVNHELEAFSYSVSHDLRSPLRAIDGFSKILLEDHSEQLNGEAKDCLARVRSAAQRMDRLIGDLLSLSRLTRQELHGGDVDLSALARGVMEELRPLEPGRDVEVVIADGLTTVGDATLLRALLENLLGNAWKFTGRRASARIEFGAQPQANGERVFFVRDDGAGFDPAYSGKLFGAFQRLHTISEFDGTGIGLATVQRIVHRHGGRVWAEGAVDAGATFYFALPNLETTNA